MEEILVAQAQTSPNWWVSFVDTWGNSASVVGFFITIIGFIITWIMQRNIRLEIKKSLQKVARQVIQSSLDQLQSKLKMVKENVAIPSWQRALDCCNEARDIALRTLGNPHLNQAEIAGMRSHADDLAQIRDYIRANKLVPDAPPVFQKKKNDALEAMITFVTTVQVRLDALIWEA